MQLRTVNVRRRCVHQPVRIESRLLEQHPVYQGRRTALGEREQFRCTEDLQKSDSLQHGTVQPVCQVLPGNLVPVFIPVSCSRLCIWKTMQKHIVSLGMVL